MGLIDTFKQRGAQRAQDKLDGQLLIAARQIFDIDNSGGIGQQIGMIQKITELLEAGANPNAQDTTGFPALYYLVKAPRLMAHDRAGKRFDHHDIIHAAVARGGDIHAPLNDGSTILTSYLSEWHKSGDIASLFFMLDLARPRNVIDGQGRIADDLISATLQVQYRDPDERQRRKAVAAEAGHSIIVSNLSDIHLAAQSVLKIKRMPRIQVKRNS